MTITIDCPQCHQKYRVSKEVAGKKVRCPGCGNVFLASETELPEVVLTPLSQPSAEEPGDAGASGRQGESLLDDLLGPAAGGVQPPSSAGFGPPVQPAAVNWTAPSPRRNVAWKKPVGLILGVCLGLVLLVVFISLVGRVVGGSKLRIASAPLPSFPQLPRFETDPNGFLFASVDLPVPANRPGYQSKIFILLPEGSHSPHSLPCVFCAAPGGTLLTGAKLFPSVIPQLAPWVFSGFAVIAYELDGACEEGAELVVHRDDFMKAYPKFIASQAGMVNARNAIEFTLARVVEVDPNRLYAVGWYETSTTALLFAAHEPRIRGCVALHPTVDVEQDAWVYVTMRDWNIDGPVKSFLHRSSPLTYVSRIKCPLFLFHGDNDSWELRERTKGFVDRLAKTNSRVTYENDESGYGPGQFEREGGLSKAIRWLKELDQPGSTTPPLAKEPEPASQPPVVSQQPPSSPSGSSAAPGQSSQTAPSSSTQEPPSPFFAEPPKGPGGLPGSPPPFGPRRSFGPGGPR